MGNVKNISAFENMWWFKDQRENNEYLIQGGILFCVPNDIEGEYDIPNGVTHIASGVF